MRGGKPPVELRYERGHCVGVPNSVTGTARFVLWRA